MTPGKASTPSGTKFKDILENLYKKQLQPLMALYLQDPVQKGEAASYSRLKEMVRRDVEQKARDFFSTALNEHRSLQGAAARKGNPKGNSKGNAQETIRDRKHGDCKGTSPFGKSNKQVCTHFQKGRCQSGYDTRRARSTSKEAQFARDESDLRLVAN